MTKEKHSCAATAAATPDSAAAAKREHPPFMHSKWRVFPTYVERNGVENIKNYKYHAGQYTPLDNLMNYFWEFCVKCTPRWVAPNVLTVMGFGCVLAGALLYVFATRPPYFVSPPPQWFYWTNAFLIFAYQTLDAMDGKQARRTQSFSPLGTLMDHGCDIVSLPLIAFTSLGVLRAGTSFLSFLFFAIAGQALQFIFFWLEYQFGVFETNADFAVSMGVTEAQFGCMLLNIIGAMCHGDFYIIDLLNYAPRVISKPLALMGATHLHIGWVVASIVVFNNLVLVIGSTYGGFKSLFLESKLKFDRFTAVGQVVHNWCFIFLEYIYYSVVFQLVAETSQWKGTLVVCGMLTMTASYSVLVLRLLLSSTCRYSYSPIQWPSIPFELFSVYAFLGYKLELSILPGFYWFDKFFTFLLILLAIFYVWILVDLLVGSWNFIANYLGIKVFSITPIKEEEKKKS